MKTIIISILISIFLYTNLFSQSDSTSRLAKDYKLNFAIPESPAFKILGKEPSNILRPSSSDLISFIASNALNPSDLSLPNSYAAELSPALLVNRNVTLQKYRDNYFWYNLRFSIGSSKDSKSGNYNLGVGLRATVIDKSDLRNDKIYLDGLFKIMDNREEYKRTVSDTFNARCKYCDMSNPDTQEKKQKYIETEMKKYDESHNIIIDEYLDTYRKSNWNNSKLDFAFAVLGSSPDSLAKNVNLSKLSLWSTFAFGISDFGQVLIGGNLFYNSLSEKGGGSLASRFYLGGNDIKGFLEIQFKNDNNDKSDNWMLGLGTEFSFLNNVWLNYYIGYENNKVNKQSDSKFNSHFDIKFALN